MKKTIAIFYTIAIIIGCKDSSNIIKSGSYKNINPILIDLSKSYVNVIESTELPYKNDLFKFYKIDKLQFQDDSIKFHQAVSELNLSNLGIVDSLLSDSLNTFLTLPMIYSRHPFQNTIVGWDYPNNWELVKKVLIHDYFIERELIDNKKREYQIDKINQSFDLVKFKKWFSENRHLKIGLLRSKFSSEFK